MIHPPGIALVNTTCYLGCHAAWSFSWNAINAKSSLSLYGNLRGKTKKGLLQGKVYPSSY